MRLARLSLNRRPIHQREKRPPLSRQNFMAQTKTSRVRFRLRSPLLLVWLAVQTAESGLAQTTPVGSQIPSVFRPESTPAHSIYELSLLVLTVTGLIFAVVFGLILYAIVRYRRRSG